MPRPPRIPPALLAGLVLAVALDTAIQISWKLSVSGIAPAASLCATLAAALREPWFYVAMAGLAAQFANWLWVLSQADLSFAQPFTALGYITVLTVSHHSLHERLSPLQLLGVALVLIGVFFISRTPHVAGLAEAGPGPKP